MRLKAEDIAFWILTLAAIFVILWLLKGSPTLNSAVITTSLFIISSEFMLWKKYFEVDKNTAISFIKLKNGISNINKNIINLNNGQNEINNKLNNIEILIKR